LATAADSRVVELLKKKDELAERLRKGRDSIHAANEKGSDKADYYFEFWLSLLTDYEQTIEQLRKQGVPEESLL
jgi:hypothetical protein